MKIIWSPTARTKIKEILEHISEDNPKAALTLIDKLETKVEKLILNPESGRVLPKIMSNTQLCDINTQSCADLYADFRRQ